MTASSTDSCASRTPREDADVLVVFPFCLDHVGHGNIQRILSLSRYLAASGLVLDLVYQANPTLPVNHSQYSAFRDVHRVLGGVRSHGEAEIARQLAAFHAGHELPAAHLRPSGALTALVRSLLDAKPYRAVLSTYAWTAPIFSRPGRPLLRVLDVQDILHEHADACRKATGGSTSFVLPRETEEYLWRQWDLLLAISPDDQRRIERELAPGQQVLCVRHAVESPAAAPAPGEDDVAFFAASDNASNVRAARWLLHEVWPRVVAERPRAQLRVAGLVCRALPEGAAEIAGVRLLGFQPDLSGAIASCGVVVAPYLYGSGLKIKVVEAACLGKAIVTTSAGLAGSGLDPGRALAVHDAPDAFARAVADLLGRPERREALGLEALAQAKALFCEQECYEPVSRAIRLLAPDGRPAGPATLSPDVLDRVALAHRTLRPRRVVAWGNGAHTRALIKGLSELGVHVTHIAHKGATGATTSSPEGLPVVPPNGLEVGSDDLIVLSSETFEAEMWHDLAAWRASGIPVLGLYDHTRISPGLVARLTDRTRVDLNAPSARTTEDERRTLLLCDSGAAAARWWRHDWLAHLAGAAGRDGWDTKVALPVAAGVAGVKIAGAGTLPVIEACDGAMGAQGLDAVVREAAVALGGLRRACAASGDPAVVLMVAPTVADCLGLAQWVREGCTDPPAAFLYYPFLPDESEREASGTVSPGILRLALAELFHVCGGRVVLAAGGDRTAAALRSISCRPVRTLGLPGTPRGRTRRRGRSTLLCAGDVMQPGTGPLLEAVATTLRRETAGAVRLAWRCDTGGPRATRSRHRAHGVACALGGDLLDDADAAEMQATIERARGVIILDASSEDEWAAALSHSARLAGVPLIVPAHLQRGAQGAGTVVFAAGNPEDLAGQVERVLRLREEGSGPLVPRQARMASQAFTHVFRELLESLRAGGHDVVHESGEVEWNLSAN